MEANGCTAVRRKVIIDTDAGIDDAAALFMAVSREDVDVIAITAVTGNTDSYQVALNVARILKIAGKQDVPIYKGSNRAILGIKCNSAYYHGLDGLGDVLLPNPDDSSHIQSEHAVSTIIRLVKQYPGEVSIIALGPLTNIALALKMEPSLGKYLAGLYAMGGNYQGRGNVCPKAEFNFYADPEAAFIVLNELHCPITLVTWELCLEYTFSWDWFDTYIGIDTMKGRFMHQIEKTTIERFYRKQPKGSKESRYIMADQIIMAVFLDDSILEKCESAYCTVELGGQICRGEMVVDWMSKLQKEPNVKIVTGLNHDMLGTLVMDGLQD